MPILTFDDEVAAVDEGGQVAGLGALDVAHLLVAHVVDADGPAGSKTPHRASYCRTWTASVT